MRRQSSLKPNTYAEDTVVDVAGISVTVKLSYSERSLKLRKVIPQRCAETVSEKSAEAIVAHSTMREGQNSRLRSIHLNCAVYGETEMGQSPQLPQR